MNDFDNGRIRLMQGDCLERMQEIPDQSIDLVLTDPPYGTTACKWDSIIPFAPMWQELKRIIKPKSAIVLFGSQPFTSALIMSNPQWFRYEWIWDKYTPTGFLHAKRSPLKQHENIVIFSEGTRIFNPQKFIKPYNGKRNQNEFKGYKSKSGVYGSDLFNPNAERSNLSHPKSIIQFRTGNGWTKKKNIHPTQKPVDLLEYLIRTYTQEDEVVLDFTFGSCSTGIAAVNTNRKFIGIELDETYYQLGLARIQQHLEELAGRML